jgi:PAS domain S-box-containing protein
MVITKLRTQLSVSLDQASACLQLTENVLDQLQRRVANYLQQVGHDLANDLRNLRAGSRDALIVVNGRIARMGSQISAASRQAAMKLQTAQNAIIGLDRSIADKPRRTKEARWARESELRSSLASSVDPVVVTDSDRRIVAANAKALELFGISELNMRNFTLDTFVANVEPRDLDRYSSLESGEARLSRCKIRRLDGGLRIAECQLVAGIVPCRHLFKFLNTKSLRYSACQVKSKLPKE